MFDTRKFGAHLSALRKKADMTQSALADQLGVTRQSVSNYERGDSFPDVDILLSIADVLGVAVDTLIRAGEPSEREAAILKQAVNGDEDIVAASIDDVVRLAPFLKPSVLNRLADSLKQDGIDLSHLVALAEYLGNETLDHLLETATLQTVDGDLLGMLLPFLSTASKTVIFEKILSHELEWHLIKPLLPHASEFISQMEAAVMDGALPGEVLNIISAYVHEREGL